MLNGIGGTGAVGRGTGTIPLHSPAVRQTGAQRGAAAAISVTKSSVRGPTETGFDDSQLWTSPIMTSAHPDVAISLGKPSITSTPSIRDRMRSLIADFDLNGGVARPNVVRRSMSVSQSNDGDDRLGQ